MNQLENKNEDILKAEHLIEILNVTEKRSEEEEKQLRAAKAKLWIAENLEFVPMIPVEL